MGYGIALPVHFLGKAATFNLLYAFPLLLATTGHGWLATVSRPFAWAFVDLGHRPVLVGDRALRDPGAAAARGRPRGSGRADRQGARLMRAVVMAGGEGTRLRPMTANQPKPLLPVVNRPIMEHVLRLLKRHGFDETVVTVQFLAALVRNYFGDGDELGMDLSLRHRGDAARHRRQRARTPQDALRDEPFLVISGDALTDFDLSDMVRLPPRARGARHRGAQARAEPAGVRHRHHRRGRPDRALPGEADLGPGVLRHRQHRHLRHGARGPRPRRAGRGRRLVRRRLPQAARRRRAALRLRRRRLLGGRRHRTSRYLRAQADVLNRQVDVDIDGFEVSSRRLGRRGRRGRPRGHADRARCTSAATPRSRPGAELREYTVLGSNVVVKGGAFLHRAVVHDNVYIGPQAALRGCVIGKNTDIMRAAQVEEGVVVGDECVVEEEAILGDGVAVYPFKTIEAGAVVNTERDLGVARPARTVRAARRSAGWSTSRSPRSCASGWPRAYATTLAQGQPGHRRARRLAGRPRLQAGGDQRADGQRDQRARPRGVDHAGHPLGRAGVGGSVGGIMMRTTPGDSQSIDIVFLDEQGADLSRGAAAQARADLQPAGVPPGVPRRDRRAALRHPHPRHLRPGPAASASTPGGCARPA